MAKNENPNFDVLNAISILAKKLEKSKLRIRKTCHIILIIVGLRAILII